METQTTSIVLAILIEAALLFAAFKTDILRENKATTADFKHPFSFSNTQMFFWLLILAPAVCLNWGYNPTKKPYLDLGNTEIILLSIIGGITLTSKVIANAHAQTAGNPPIGVAATTNEIRLKAINLKSKCFIIDILSNDSGQFSIARLQQAIFTIVFGVVYVTMFFKDGKAFPEFEQNAYLLMGISGSSYLLGKGLKV